MSTTLEKKSGNERHIAHLCPQATWGGAEIYAADLAQRQIKMGIKAVVWTTPNSPIHQHCLKNSIPVETSIKLYRFNFFNLSHMTRMIQKNQITHLHLHKSVCVSAVFGIKWFVPVRIYFHLHIWPGCNKKDLLHKIIYRPIDKVIVAGQRSAADLIKTHPISNQQVATLPYGLDLNRFNSVTNQRQQLGYMNSDFIVGIFARIDRQKGIKEFLVAFDQLISNGVSAKAIIMGDKTIGDPDAVLYENEIHDLIKQPTLKNHIQLKPFNRNYLSILNSVDIMVLPSYEETYALTILDAFYLQKPVLSTHAGGTPDLVTTERGWLAQPKSSASIYTLLNEIYKNLNAIKIKGENAKKYVESKHSFSSVMNQLEEIYEY